MESLSKGKNMRTLDEVIKLFEAFSNKRYDLYEGPAQSTVTDALHYLKHLQEYYEMSREHHEPNPALTWEQLKQMEGKPVWIEFLNDEGEWNGEWCLVESSNNILCEILRCKMSWWGLRKITLGKTWQAYRKEIM